MSAAARVVLVTGGNSGIGFGIAQAFVNDGCTVVIVGRDEGKGVAAREQLARDGADVHFVAADLSEEFVAQVVVDEVITRFGRLDVVVNNAGMGARRSPVTPTDSAATRLRILLANNLEPAYYVSVAALKHWSRHPGGAIVNISSTASLHGTWGNYGVAKAALEALTRALAVQGAPHRVRVNGVSPGWISTEVTTGTPATDRAASLFGRMGTPAEIAAAVRFLASAEASFVTGQTLVVDGGLVITDYPSQPWLDAVGHWKLFADLNGSDESKL